MVNLIIGGGNIKGIAYIGSLEYLYKNNLLVNLNKFYGTSVGSIIGIFYCTGYKPFEIFCILKNLNFDDYWDFKFENIEKRYSLVTELLFIEIKKIYSKKENEKITFKQFYDKYKIDINIYATSLKSRKTICFNKDTEPNLEIFTAVQASASIPFVFPPVIINNEFFIDGCMKCIDGVCNEIIETNANDINYIIKANYESKEINSFMDYLAEVINCTLQNDTQIINDYTVDIKLPDKYDNKYNFNNTDANSKIELYYMGITQAQNKFENNIEKFKEEEKKLIEKNKINKLIKLI